LASKDNAQGKSIFPILPKKQLFQAKKQRSMSGTYNFTPFSNQYLPFGKRLLYQKSLLAGCFLRKTGWGAEGSFLLSFCAFGRTKEVILAEASTPADLLEARQMKTDFIGRASNIFEEWMSWRK
jgi:hypothetical protein